MICIEIAGLKIGIDNKYPNIEKISAEYLTEDAPLFTVSVSEREIEEERKNSEKELTDELKARGAVFSDGYLESVALYRKIAERLPFYDAVVFHGSAVSLDGRAYIFTAKSGVGKTTHTRLWQSRFGDRFGIINGDKPILRFIDGVPYICGTPWRGKENYGKNEIKPLLAIAFLERAKENRAAPMPKDEAVMRLIPSLYLPKTSEGASLAMNVADRLISSVGLVRVSCNMDAEAAEVSAEALSQAGKND